MHVQERQAWYIAIVIVGSFILYFGVVSVIGFHHAAFASFAPMGLAGFAPFIGRREKKAGKVVFDERDIYIGKAAGIAGFSVFWIVFVGVSVAIGVLMGPDATIQVGTIAYMLYPAMGIIFLVRSIVIIFIYRRDSHAEEV